jgi:hypothetical protein
MRMVIQSQPRQIAPRDPISKQNKTTKTFTKIGLVKWLKGNVLSSSPSTSKKKKKVRK